MDKTVRPHLEGLSGPHLATGELTYIFRVSPSKVHEAIERLLRDRFAVLHVRAEEKTDIEQYARYSEIRTEFLYYQESGKKYRKKCRASVYLIPAYQDYIQASISCVLDVYEFGLTHGRGGIHNLFSQWWGWYPEHGLYAAEDLLEEVSRKLSLKESEIIRLNKKDFYTADETLQLIKERER